MMMMIKSTFLMTVCLAFVSVTVAVPFEPMAMIAPEASPMAEVDPMTMPMGPMLYLVPAGRAPYTMTEKKLSLYKEKLVCPEQYGSAGFSIRCDVGDAKTSGPVLFRVDGKAFRHERHAPYFLNGDKAGKIFRYKGLDVATDVRVVCKVNGHKAVWVDLKRKC